MGFVQTNYHIIMREIDRIMSEKGVSTQELVLELELYKDLGQESSLANQDKFKVGVTQEYLEGNRPKSQKCNDNAFCLGTLKNPWSYDEQRPLGSSSSCRWVVRLLLCSNQMLDMPPTPYSIQGW